MENRNLEGIPMEDLGGSNPVLTLITTEDGIPTSTEVTVLTTPFGDVPLMTAALGTLAEVPLGTSHPTFVTSHPGVSTVYATSIAPNHAGQTVVVSDGEGRFTVMDSDGVRQAIVVHAADPVQITNAFAQVQGVGPSIMSFQEVHPTEIRAITQGLEGAPGGRTLIVEQAQQPSVLEMQDLPTQILEEEEEAGDAVESQEVLGERPLSDPQAESTNQPVSEVTDTEPVSESAPAETSGIPVQDQQDMPETEVIIMSSSVEEPTSPPLPDEVVCLVCYQAFLNPKRKKKEESADKQKEESSKVGGESTGRSPGPESESIVEGCEETTSYGRSLGRFFELSRVSMSIVTRRSYKDYDVPICQSCNKNLVQAESIIQDLRRLEKELFFLRGKIKDEICNSYNFFKSQENKELAESRRNMPGLLEILEIVDRIREDIINDGRPPKMPKLIGASNRRGRKPKKLLAETTGDNRSETELPSTDAAIVTTDTAPAKSMEVDDANSTPKDGTQKDSANTDAPVDAASTTATSDPTTIQSAVTTIKPEAEEEDVKPAIRTSFGRIIKRPAYMMTELAEDELSELGESSEDNYEEIEVKPDIPMDAVEEGFDPLVAINRDDIDEEEEDPAWCPRKGMIISEKVGIPTSSSEESEELTDYDSDLEATPKLKVKKKVPKERKRKRVKKPYKRQKTKQKTKQENVNYEVKVIQLDGTELMTINTTNADDNIGLEPEITQKVMDSQAVIMVKNQLFGKRVQCPHCSRSFTDPTRRDVHVKKKHEGDTKPFGCSVCPKRFGRQDHLRNHMKRHSRPPKDKSFRIKTSSGQKSHKCQFCDQKFRNKSELNIHTRLHTGERPFKCEHCLEGFVSALKREFHVEQVHPEVPPLRCEFCAKGFFRQHRLRIHAVSHTGEKTNICEICGKCFSQAAMLRYHQTTHEELNMRQFKCQECSRVFANPQNLKSHMESQHQKMYRHRCDTCGRGYTQMSHLRRHLRTHSGEQPFTCSYCPKKFTSGAALKIHIRIHTGERPYWCAQCEKGFRSKTKLGRHMKTLIHSGDANKMKKDASMTEIEAMDVGDDVNATTSATWTEIVGIITGV